MRHIFLVLTIAITLSMHLASIAQSTNSCNCKAMVNLEYKGRIQVFQTPGGELIRSLGHNFKTEDYLILTIDKDSAEYFKAHISYGMSRKKPLIGWIRKNKQLGTFARQYDPNGTLLLYTKPDKKSPVQSKINGLTDYLFTIKRCSQKWAYVSITNNGKTIEGWLPPDKQCANPYTTCN